MIKKIDRICITCGKGIKPRGCRVRKFCSLPCYWIEKKGKPQYHGHKISAALKGKKKSPEHVRKVADALRGKLRPQWSGEKHYAWLGEFAGYDSLHDWVVKYRGKEKKCSHCGVSDKQKVYHWANLSGQYKRELDDWVRVCVPCHSKMDKGRGSMRLIWDKIGDHYHRKGRTFNRQ